MKYTRVDPRSGSPRYESEDGRIVVYKNRRRRRLPRMAYGRWYAIDDFWTATVDGKIIRQERGGAREFRLLKDAKHVAEARAQGVDL
jgi:hypothetical protein